jgi:uncharacterized repeat protein (TIGR02543 family)
MKEQSRKKTLVSITALLFLCTAFIPTVHSQLGTKSLNQQQPTTTMENPVPETTNTVIQKNQDLLRPSDIPLLDNTPPNVHLPTSQVTLTVYSSTTSYFRSKLTNVPAGYEVTNKNYSGWCSDSAHTISLNTPYQVTLYSSYNTSLPTHLYHQNWSKVNYILNHKVGSDWHQVEYAILYILDFGNQGLNTNGWTMVNNAIQYGGSYVPDGGNIIAIIADAGVSIQRTIFELVVPIYTLTLSVNGQGTIAKNPDQANYTYGENVVLTANPSVGWSFSQWGGDLSGSTNPSTISMTGNKSVSATFTQNVYTLTVTVSPSAGGSVSQSPSPPYHYGDVVTLTATANTGYSFSAWSGDASGTSPVTTVTMNGNKAVTATFTQNVYTLTVTVSPSAGGSVSQSPSPPYHYGDVVTLTATANTGYSFDHWSGDASGTSPVTTVTMNGNKSVTATFTQNEYTLSITIDPTGGGTVSQDPSPPYHYGDVVTLTAIANEGYTFYYWSGDASGSSTVTTVTMDGNKSVTAHFIESEYSLTITVDPAAGGTVTVNPGPPYHNGDVVTLTATANNGYTFDHWSGDASGTSPVTTVTMDGDKTVIAHFTQKSYKLTILIDGLGSVLKNPNQNTYPYNSVVTLTAVADSNWMFSSWSGDLTGNENPDTIIMNGNKTVTAHFIQSTDTIPPTVEIAKPGNAVYFMNNKIIPFKSPVVILSINLEVNASDNDSGIDRVEFYVDGILKGTDSIKPYTCEWKDLRSGKRTIEAVAYDKAGNSASTELPVFKWRLHPIILVILILIGMLLDSYDAPWQR